jgi:hypothetical protein
MTRFHSQPATSELTSTQQAIVDDHIRAGVPPPVFAPSKPQVVTHVWNSEVDDD